MTDLMEKDAQYVANTYGRSPIEVASGKGSIITDVNGKTYIDLGSGIAVNTFGLADEEWIAATTAQMKKYQHTSNLYYSEPCVLLAETLCKRTGMKKVFFGNSGAEANECAIKTARKYAAEHKDPSYYTIITLKNSFHGRTITTLAATGQDVFHQSFTPLTDGFVYATANDLKSVEDLVSANKVAGIMVECVQGEGGVNVLSDAFVKGIADICKKEDIIFIVDEVQTGNGRTGALYAYMNYGVNPDIVTTAKGLGGGLPIGACMFGEKTEFVLKASDHGSTFGGNPVASAGALSIINRIDDKLLADVRKKGEYIRSSLTGAKGVELVTGTGLIIGVKPTRPLDVVMKECFAAGLICLTAKDKLRLLPALNIPQDVLEQAIAILKEVLGRDTP
ncbi:MAG TPA: acetylornithine/succinylornithine family transaminase [Methanocorpusculum sp.]|nr:acetylornithine/succinylornithine family transaminase [Methanocorpusculum sp.]